MSDADHLAPGQLEPGRIDALDDDARAHLAACPRCRIEARWLALAASPVPAELPGLQRSRASLSRSLASSSPESVGSAESMPLSAPVPVGDVGGEEALPASIGRWRLLEVLGRGGMGIVVGAEHMDDGRRCALKTVRVPSPHLLAGLRREIKQLAELRHPGIVRVIDHGVEGGLPWLAMERVEGVTLRSIEYNMTSRCANLTGRR